MKFTLKIYQNGKKTIMSWTKRKRKILKILRSIKWQVKGIKVYLRVVYGMGKDVYGKRVLFYNDGYYDGEYFKNRKEMKEAVWLAFNTFTEAE